MVYYIEANEFKDKEHKKDMNNKSEISIIIYANPESAVFAGALSKTINSIVSQETYSKERVQLLVTTEKEMIEELKETINKSDDPIAKDNCVAAGADDLAKVLESSRYLFFVENGDVLESGSLKILLKHAKKNEYTVVCLTSRKWVRKMKSEFQSCTVLETEPLMNVRGVMIRCEAINDLTKLLGHDHDALMELSEVIISGRGYYMEYNGILTAGPADDPAFSPDAAKMQELMSLAKETFPGATLYVEILIQFLINRNLELQVNMKDISSSLMLIRDDTILTIPGFNIHKRLHFLNLKYEKDIMEDAQVNDDGVVLWNGMRLFGAYGKNRLRINIVDFKDGEIWITGISDLNLLGSKYRILVIEENGNRIPVELKPDHLRDIVWPNGDIIHEGKQFEVRIPLRPGSNFEFVLEDTDERQILLLPGMERFSRMPKWDRDGFFVKDGYLITMNYGRFCVERNNAWKHLKAEYRYDRHLWITERRKVILYRLMHYVYHLFQRKPVWIVADRPHVAGDNGEHMFRYLMQSDAAKNHEIRFLIRKDSKDYERIKSIGPVLEYESLKHRLKFMETTMVIAAAANDLATSAFGKAQAYYRNLCDYEFVYLRHGVAKDDQSRFLNKQRKNIRALLSTSTREHDAIIAGRYGYTEREVKLTGLPRFDNLYDEREKKITILPTWRKNLEGGRVEGSSEREYIVDFKDTDYYKFYNSLINDERLLGKMRELGFTGTFYLHPVFEEQFNDFQGNDVFKVGTTVADYQTLFRESSIMVTDFSSVAFDFAYLKKPLIYSQFDEKTFYKDHSWDRGYFSYREDGFGPITNTLEETVDTLIGYMESGCQMEELYLKRVDSFFPFTDRNNCKRVYDVIMEVEDSKKASRRAAWNTK